MKFIVKKTELEKAFPSIHWGDYLDDIKLEGEPIGYCTHCGCTPCARFKKQEPKKIERMMLQTLYDSCDESSTESDLNTQADINLLHKINEIIKYINSK